MPEIGLQRSGIDALVGQRVAAGMPVHVRMHLEPDLGFIAGPGVLSLRNDGRYPALDLAPEERMIG